MLDRLILLKEIIKALVGGPSPVHSAPSPEVRGGYRLFQLFSARGGVEKKIKGGGATLNQFGKFRQNLQVI